MALDPDFVALFSCPKCRGKLAASKSLEGAAGFGCKVCALFYCVQDDVPNFIVEDARSWTPSNTESA